MYCDGKAWISKNNPCAKTANTECSKPARSHCLRGDAFDVFWGCSYFLL